MEVLSLIRSVKNSFAPINRIPPEVLLLIPDYDNDDMDQGLITLTHVCRGWRDMFISRSSLWTQLDCMNFDKILRSDPTGSGRTEGGRKDESSGQLLTAHTRTRAGGNEIKSRGDRRWPELSRRIRAFRRTSDRDEGEVSNISSKVCSYEYRRYIY